MASITGLDCKSYRNTGTAGSPTWNEITNVRDESLSMERAKSDISVRGGNGWRLNAATLATGTVTFKMLYDTAQDDFAAFRDAFLNKTQIDCAFADGPIATTGTQYFRAVFVATKFDIGRNLEEGVMVDVELEPTYHATVTPGFTTVP